MEPDEVAQPYRDLLCHEHDMTSTLSDFHKGEVELQIFEERFDSDCYFREVLLRVGNKPVEYGMIRIFLASFPEELELHNYRRHQASGDDSKRKRISVF